MITAIRPKLAVVSEFGEELRGFRDDLSKILKEVVEAFFKGTSGQVPNVMPGDTPFIYDIADEKIYCVATEKMAGFAEIDFLHCNETDTFYYCKSAEIKKHTPDSLKDKKMPSWRDSFVAKRTGNRLYYFKQP